MSIIGIDAITFGVTNQNKAMKFLSHWGLKKMSSGSYGANYTCADNTEVKLRHCKNKGLPQAIQAGATIREVIWGVQRQRDLNKIEKELSKDRKVRILKDKSLRTVDDMGLGIGFRISRRKELDPEPLSFNMPGRTTRVDKRAKFYDRAEPLAISHIVFGVPDCKVIEEFYGRIGFVATDRYYSDRGVFLRASERGNHHNLFVMNIGGRKPKFNHVAFKVRDIHEVIGGGQFLNKNGWETAVGPGRHYISSGCFWYFKSPLGGALEYCADEDIATEKWQTRMFEVGPEIFSEWTFNADEEFKAPTASSRAK